MIRHHVRLCALLGALLTATACGPKDVIPQNVANPDRFLFDRGEAALKEKKWLEAREYYRQVFDNYPQSPLRPDAKIGLADTYLGEKSTDSLVLADGEYREFLTYYPRHPRADYAQYKLAMTYFQQMRGPDRDQTSTREALTEFQAFFDRFPDSPLTPEVRKNWRIARDRLSDSELARRRHVCPHRRAARRCHPLPGPAQGRPEFHTPGRGLLPTGGDLPQIR